MTIAELLLPEVDQEMATTRRVLERVPDDKLSWKPHDKSFSMGDLASHIVNMIKWTDVTMNQTEFDLATVPPEQMNQAASSRAQLLEWFNANIEAGREGVVHHAARRLRAQLLPEPRHPSPRAVECVPAPQQHSRAVDLWPVSR
jgi:uncharacterized damage-inducible protein DinB